MSGSVGSAPKPTREQVFGWLEEVPDPEVPAVSIVDLGIVRDVRWAENDELVVTVTPTYSGCPATELISNEIEQALRSRGIERLRLEMRLSPAWTTDWLSERGREKLRAFGIAPPAHKVIDISGLSRGREPDPVPCPRCGSGNTAVVSRFGSTACKALMRCNECLEPFDYFKPH